MMSVIVVFCSRLVRILILVLCSVPVYAAAFDDPRTKASFYINTYGLTDISTSPLAKRAHAIFKRIRQVAEDPVGMYPTLKIINRPGKTGAITLTDVYFLLLKPAWVVY